MSLESSIAGTQNKASLSLLDLNSNLVLRLMGSGLVRDLCTFIFLATKTHLNNLETKLGVTKVITC